MSMTQTTPLQAKPSKYKSWFHRFISQLFCRHRWELVDKDEVFPEPPPGGAIAFSRPHVCTKCEKTTILGSGWIF